ncbi:MAG: hypothetical protein Q4F45_07615, partial [Alistipes sp.]|nr:hypothetical protein [Alistipes sp.]
SSSLLQLRLPLRLLADFRVMNACQVEINDFQTKNGAAIQKAMQSLSPEDQALIQAEVVQVATKYQETMVKKATEFGLM